MTSKYTRAIAGRLVARLPELPEPWHIEVLCRDVARLRGRPLTVHGVSLRGLPSGLWYDDGVSDRIIHRASATGYYRDHIILHELCHILAGHGVPRPKVVAEMTRTGPAGRAEQTRARLCDSIEEEVAETFATMVLRAAGQRPPRDLSVAERRAEELFGASRA
ncbi:hypothetical protein [Couchioplanes caeruleus]|uniref:IrrE N-terminal-like domain-containing protein n=2 Tax=Couchioplanes caeruleus TaxID=56438 RepID=A0A1K0GYC6_9ACTN|nr:hypothetical protein [Couchioplanes caeruleus]OJF14435.1 hypothetical protein BG844_09670 [Couchioplanes caeruleus subsp. caeruleus]ROP34016.1 hypothetical protein EDD30_7081 [Couchioplanes caeruleus]